MSEEGYGPDAAERPAPATTMMWRDVLSFSVNAAMSLEGGIGRSVTS